MSAARLIERLDRVRQCGPGRWIARCPAHQDGSPSLSIRELDDGRVLVHCFAACDLGAVLAAIGLEIHELFPERIYHTAPVRDRKHWHAARAALRTLYIEALIVAIAAENAAAGVVLDDVDRERLALAASRIRAAAGVAA